MRTCVRVREVGYTVVQYDRDRPWIVVVQRHETVQLAEDEDFNAWAKARYPEPRFSVQADPWALTPRGTGADRTHGGA